MNLNAVDVRIVSIYRRERRSIPPGERPGRRASELARVGRLIKKTTVPLRAKDAVGPAPLEPLLPRPGRADQG